MLPLLFYLTQILIQHLNSEGLAWRSNKNKHVQSLECVLASAHLRHNLCLDTSDEISERGCTSANILRSLPFTEQRSVPARGGADTRHFARTSKLLRSAVQRRRLKIKICRWPRWAAFVPSGLAEIYPSANVSEGCRLQQRRGDAGTVDGRWFIGGLREEQRL